MHYKTTLHDDKKIDEPFGKHFLKVVKNNLPRKRTK